MAREIIFKVGTQEAVKNVADLQNNIKLLKEQLKDSTKSFEENQQAVKALRENQAALRQAMYDTGVEFSEVQKAAIGVNSALEENSKEVNIDAASYNELVRSMDILKQQWRATTDETTRAELGEKINQVNNRLKELDASVGNYQRNVGNYVGALNQFTSAFSAMGAGAQRVINPIKNTTGALQVMSKTPVVAILGLLANALSSIISNLKSSEENANATAQAFSLFAAAGDLVKNVMQALGKALSSVVGWFTTLLQDIFPKLREAAELRAEITEKEIALSYKQRDAVQKNADAELAVAKLRNDAAKKTQYTAEERLKMLQQANDLELSISRRNKEVAEQEYAVALLKSKTAKNTKEENDALAAAYAKKVKAETDYYTSTIRLNKQMDTALKESREDRERLAQLDVDALKLRLDKMKEGYADYWETALEIEEKSYSIRKQKAETEILDEQERNKTLENLKAEHEHKMFQISETFSTASNERTILSFQNEMNKYKEGSIQYLEAAVQLKEVELNTLHQMELESDEAFYARKLAAEKAYNDAKKDLVNKRVDMMQNAMAATSGMLSALADAYESNTKQTKQEMEKVKALRIAGATIDMLNGVVAAISTAQELGVPMGPIMAAINSAAVIAAGVANINKIKSTQISTSGGTSAVATPPTFQPPVTQVRNLTTSTEEDRLNQMASSQRVYILSSDLEADSHSRRARVTDTTF